ncbi:hypothetical protein Fmac_005726 [Flemingia macrophylla]|uniref:Uncharacterized protein n=1 Tax=Flemingia macrophylla TaxID=520843 RepID=A0ABD1N8K8_9FABA
MTIKVTNRSPIDRYRKLGRAKDTKDPIQKLVVESESLKDLHQKVPAKSVKCLMKIKLKH